jgi:hypothetical protein
MWRETDGIGALSEPMRVRRTVKVLGPCQSGESEEEYSE